MIPELQKQDYKNVFYYFEEISKIPRGSGDNQRISDYLVAFAKEHGLSYVQDELLNVIITKEASAGYENCAPVMIQGHMDMVCEKTPTSNHDFKNDALELIVEGDWLRANNTTLGGDDGIAVAFALALLSDKDLKSPKLEVVITTDEETGMFGAKALDTTQLTAKYLINVDSENDDSVLTSCAGGLTGTATLPVVTTSANGKKMTVILTGLRGGHSGVEIGNNRSNANKLLGRLLFDLRNNAEFDLITMAGGSKDNVITRFATAEIVVASNEVDAVTEKLKEIESVYQKEFAASEPELRVEVTTGEEDSYEVLNKGSFERVMFLLMQSPYGVQAMSASISGLVESSLNLGIMKVTADEAMFCFSVRSSISSAKHAISDKLEYLSLFLGGEYEVRGEYPAWEYRADSKLRDLYSKIYKEIRGTDIKVEAIHAGLECGLFYERISDLDIISVGPNMSAIHTAQEKLGINSSVFVYKIIEQVLAEMKEI